jgi:arylsulfatase A-like enzyme
MNCIVILCDTLRRDHCGPYHLGRPLNECWSKEQPDWVVPTPNLDRLAARGTVFDNAWCGSTPCMPARRDIYTGRYEFLERGWGPLNEEDLDLPRQVSGEPNLSLGKQLREGRPVSYLVTDHFHLWEDGSGNYHMGYTGFEFIRGQEADNYATDPIDFPLPEKYVNSGLERSFRHVALFRKEEKDWFAAQVFTKAAEWVERNHTHDNFFLHIDCFSPHEPWDPPEHLLKMFDPRGYSYEKGRVTGPYDKWAKHMDEEQLRHQQARYAAHVVLTDRWLGKLFDKLDEHDLWKNTLVVFTTDHGTYNGDHGRVGKLQTHEHDAVGHIPFIVAHPQYGHGERREQLVQLVDIYPTVLSAVGRPCPPNRHGVDLLPVLCDASAPTRDYAIAGQFGKSVTITDGEWVLHQSPKEDNAPLYWYGYCWSRFMPGYKLGPFVNGRRRVEYPSWPEGTWLSDKRSDPNELNNVAEEQPERLRRMQEALAGTLVKLKAPAEQLERLGLSGLGAHGLRAGAAAEVASGSAGAVASGLVVAGGASAEAAGENAADAATATAGEAAAAALAGGKAATGEGVSS